MGSRASDTGVCGIANATVAPTVADDAAVTNAITTDAVVLRAD